MLRTLREVELEEQVYKLERELYELKGSIPPKLSLTYDYSKVDQIPIYKDLYKVVTTKCDFNNPQGRWQVEGRITPKNPKDTLGYVYYLSDEVVQDNHYLQEVLAAQHEKVIRQILATRK